MRASDWLWLALGLALVGLAVFLALPAGAAHAATVTCFPAPPAAPPSGIERHGGAVGDRLATALSAGLSGLAEGLVAWPRPDGQVAVVILRGGYACPLLVPRQDWEAARRAALGVEM